MTEIHCTACDWTTDSDSIDVLAKRALEHHKAKGIEPTVSGLQHRHVYFEDSDGESIVTCQSEEIIYKKGSTDRPLRGTSNTGSE